MKLRRYSDIQTFNHTTAAFLHQREAENNLLLGISYDLAQSTLFDDHEPYLATVSNDEEIVAVALRTPPHNLVVSRATPDAVDLIVEDVLPLYPDLPGVLGPQEASRTVCEVWREQTGKAFRRVTAERIYQLERVHQTVDVSGHLRPAGADDADLIVRWLSAFDREAFGEEAAPQSVQRLLVAYLEGSGRGLYFWEDDEPVAMVGHSGPTTNGIRVGPVYTPPRFRRRGYGTAATAALSQLLLDEGRRYCFLFTDLSNPTSNSIYQRIGYRPVVDIDEYRFEELGTRD